MTMSRVIEGGWTRKFDEPISLPKGKPLATLRDAALYITKLPKAERELPHWETTVECLMLVGDHGGDPMFPHIAMMQAMHRHEPKAAPETRQGTRSFGDRDACAPDSDGVTLK
jgi:hypothetical protein